MQIPSRGLLTCGRQRSIRHRGCCPWIGDKKPGTSCRSRWFFHGTMLTCVVGAQKAFPATSARRANSLSVARAPKGVHRSAWKSCCRAVSPGFAYCASRRKEPSFAWSPLRSGNGRAVSLSAISKSPSRKEHDGLPRSAVRQPRGHSYHVVCTAKPGTLAGDGQIDRGDVLVSTRTILLSR